MYIYSPVQAYTHSHWRSFYGIESFVCSRLVFLVTIALESQFFIPHIKVNFNHLVYDMASKNDPRVEKRRLLSLRNRRVEYKDPASEPFQREVESPVK